jgi:lambda family phage portal protein
LRQRARELRRNNAYAHRALQVITTNVVGSGIKPVFKIKNKAMKEFFDSAWDQWAERSKECDFDGFHNIQGLQSQIMDATVESGECFVLRKRQPRSSGVPLRLQVLEADFLDTSFNQDLSGGGKIRQGIEFNQRGEKVAYHFFKSHPGEKAQVGYQNRVEKVRITAEKVAHVFDKKRPGQIRGVTFLHPVMIRLRDLDIFQDASLRKQQISACFSAFIYNSTGDTLENTYSNKSEWELLEKLDSGTIETLPPGFDIKFADPPSSDNYPDFVKTELMSIASGLGITYEALTQDYGNVNFSSARMGFLEFQRNIKRWQNEIVINQFLEVIFEWFVDALQFAPGASRFNISPDKVQVSWTTPAREMIDPAKEVPAARDAVKAGFKSISEVIRSQGYNPDEVFQERSEEIEKLKALGISTDSDPSLSNKQGAPKANDDKGDDENENEENQD